MMGRLKSYLIYLILALFMFPFPSLSLAQPYYGANFSYTLISTSPGPLDGYQLMLTYDPQLFQWHHFDIYFDGGFSYFHAPEAEFNTNINIYSIAPILRFSFNNCWLIKPYLEFSIGIAYLNHTHLEKRNLGIHFAFQDRLGFGAFLGENISLGLHAVHYSNARFSAHNSGITVPLVIDIGFRF